MVKSLQMESRQPSSIQSSTNQSRRRSNRASSALTLLLAVQACTLGTVVSARPGVVMARSESGSFQALSATTSTISSSSVMPPFQLNEAKVKYRQAEEVTQEYTSTSFSSTSQPSVTAIARSIGDFPTVTLSSSATSSTVTGDSPVLLRQADPEPSASASSSVSTIVESATATSTSAAAFDVQPTATETAPASTQTPVTSTDDSKEVAEAESEGNNVQKRDTDDVEDDESSGDASSDGESCSSDEEVEYQQDNVKSFPVASTLDQVSSALPLKRYAAVYDAALHARSFSGFVETIERSKRSWFDDALSSNPGNAAQTTKIQKDDGEMYSVMKRMIASHQKQVDIHKRLLDLVANASSKRRQESSIDNSSPPNTEDEIAFPIVSSSASPSEDVQKRDGETIAAIHNQWNEHDQQCICSPSSSTAPSASSTGSISATSTTKRDSTPTDEKRHQLLASAMSDWSFVSGWLSSRLPVDLHKQVVEALQQSSQQQIQHT